MSKLNLLKGLLGSLVLGASLSLPLLNAEEPILFSPILAPRTALLLEEKYRVNPDQSDVDISVYLQDKCGIIKNRQLFMFQKKEALKIYLLKDLKLA